MLGTKRNIVLAVSLHQPAVESSCIRVSSCPSSPSTSSLYSSFISVTVWLHNSERDSKMDMRDCLLPFAPGHATSSACLFWLSAFPGTGFLQKGDSWVCSAPCTGLGSASHCSCTTQMDFQTRNRYLLGWGVSQWQWSVLVLYSPASLVRPVTQTRCLCHLWSEILHLLQLIRTAAEIRLQWL